jgi:hypothetical protein
MAWTPATIEEVKQLVEQDLQKCDTEQAAAFKRFYVEPYLAPIVRFGNVEQVVVVARKEGRVIYWEDVEEGFGVSTVGTDGHILEQDCSQNDLGLALDAWIRRGR